MHMVAVERYFSLHSILRSMELRKGFINYTDLKSPIAASDMIFLSLQYDLWCFTGFIPASQRLLVIHIIKCHIGGPTKIYQWIRQSTERGLYDMISSEKAIGRDV